MSIRVFLVDDQELVRAGIGMVIGSQPDLEVVGEARDGRDALDRLALDRADVVLMDVRMPVMDGVEATRRLVARDDTTRVILLTTFDLDEYAFAGLKAGASGFLLKDGPPPDLLAAIRTVHAGDAVIAPSTTRRLLDYVTPQLPDRSAEPDDQLRLLTDREREVLAEVARGLSNGEIAERLHVSEATVKTHLGRILGKLGLRDRVQAVVFAYEHGLVRASG